jgi:hypothetical protein
MDMCRTIADPAEARGRETIVVAGLKALIFNTPLLIKGYYTRTNNPVRGGA